MWLNLLTFLFYKCIVPISLYVFIYWYIQMDQTISYLMYKICTTYFHVAIANSIFKQHFRE